MASSYNYGSLSGPAKKVADRAGVTILPVTDALWFGFCIQEALDARINDVHAEDYSFCVWGADKECNQIYVKAYATRWKFPSYQLAEDIGMNLVDDLNPLYRLARHGWSTDIEFLNLGESGLSGRKTLDLRYTIEIVPDFLEDETQTWMDKDRDHIIVFESKRFALPQF